MAKTQEEGECEKLYIFIFFFKENGYLIIFTPICSNNILMADNRFPAPTDPPQNVKVQSAGPGELIVHWQVSKKKEIRNELG